MSSYSEKFKDPRWQKKRLRILERDKFVCHACGSEENTLHIHHKYYEGNKNPWEYKDCSLVTLCEDCHECEQEEKKTYESLLINTLYDVGFMADDLREIACGISYLKLHHPGDVVAIAIGKFLANPNNYIIMLNDIKKPNTTRGVPSGR